MPITDVTLNNINIQSNTGLEADMVKNLVLNNVRVDSKIGAPFKISNSENLEINSVKSMSPNADSPFIKLTDSKESLIQGCFPVLGKSLILLLGGNCKGTVLMNNCFNRLPLIMDKESVIYQRRYYN